MKINVLRQAVSQRRKSMLRRCPVIIFAGLACYGLYYLDQVKQGFDEEKARPLLVDQNFRDRLKSEIVKQKDGSKKWKEIEDFISVNQASTADDFINKVVARISRERDAKDFVAQARFKSCVARALATPSEASEAQSSEQEAQNCSDTYTAADERFYREAQDKIANVYTSLKDVPLKKIGAELAGESTSKGFFQALLRPTLNDESGLHIIYQILRISLVVIIVFALLSVVSLLLITLMLGDGVKTMTEQATSFIGSGKGTLLPVGRVAALSVAALGVGTAVGAGVSNNNKADQALVQQQSALPESRRTPSRDKAVRNPLEQPTKHHDSTNTQYDIGDTNTFYDYPDQRETSASATLPPVIQVYPRVSVVDSGSGGDLGSSRNSSGSSSSSVSSKLALDPAFVSSIQSYLQNLTNMTRDLSQKINSIPSKTDEIKVANHVKPDNQDKALLVELEQATKTSISDSFKDLDNKMKSLKDSLDDLHAISLGNPANPTQRSALSSLLRGPNRYFVSKRSLEQVADVMAGYAAFYNGEKKKFSSTDNMDSAQKAFAQEQVKLYDEKIAADAAILEAMKWLYVSGGSPLEKEAFLKKLKAQLQQTSYYQQNQSMVIGRFDFLRDTILTYTRIR